LVTFGAEAPEYDKNIQDVKLINSIKIDREALKNVQEKSRATHVEQLELLYRSY
jgi:hypothetical protein